ncbi:MAG: hypothetical protein WBA93_13160 [Microcoleaceae cyanobacterium]
MPLLGFNCDYVVYQSEKRCNHFNSHQALTVEEASQALGQLLVPDNQVMESRCYTVSQTSEVRS